MWTLFPYTTLFRSGMVIQFELCNTLSVQRLQDKASIVVNALHNDIQACKQY